MLEQIKNENEITFLKGCIFSAFAITATDSIFFTLVLSSELVQYIHKDPGNMDCSVKMSFFCFIFCLVFCKDKEMNLGLMNQRPPCRAETYTPLGQVSGQQRL